MRSIIFLLGIVALGSLTAAAKDLSDWGAVQRAKPGTPLHVVIYSGNAVDGELISASDSELRLDVAADSSGGLVYSRSIPRVEIREIYKVPIQYERRLSGSAVLLSSLIGIGVGIGIGAIVDEAHPSAEDPGQGKLIGGVLGTFVGPAALAVGRLVLNATHHAKLVYRARPNGSARLPARTSGTGVFATASFGDPVSDSGNCGRTSRRAH